MRLRYLCSMAFAPIVAAYAIFMGVATLLLALRSDSARTGSRKYVAWLGALFGQGFMGPLLLWMNAVSGAYLALMISEAAFFAPTALALRMLMRLRSGRSVPTTVWVAFELLRSTIPFGGFPWGRLAYAAADTPLSAYARLPQVRSHDRIDL